MLRDKRPEEGYLSGGSVHHIKSSQTTVSQTTVSQTTVSQTTVSPRTADDTGRDKTTRVLLRRWPPFDPRWLPSIGPAGLDVKIQYHCTLSAPPPSLSAGHLYNLRPFNHVLCAGEAELIRRLLHLPSRWPTSGKNSPFTYQLHRRDLVSYFSKCRLMWWNCRPQPYWFPAWISQGLFSECSQHVTCRCSVHISDKMAYRNIVPLNLTQILMGDTASEIVSVEIHDRPTQEALGSVTDDHTYNGVTTNSTSGNYSEEASNIAQTSLALVVLKSFPVFIIIAGAIFGNILVIISVFRFERLRIIGNSFIVSLAFADLLVAIFVMPFNASQEIAGRWMFGRIVCDIFNANDVLFSTASLLHLCCISMDRYIAITDPFHYEQRMSKRRVAIMLVSAWGASALISHVPIHMGWYANPGFEHLPGTCMFVVNRVYAALSSTISFWTPATVMVFTYVKIFREARRQEKQIYALTQHAGPTIDHLNNTVGNGVKHRSSSSQSDNVRLTQERKKMKREHKAAKTLGIIMGAFLCCWLPFFLWYVSTSMCGEKCHTPDVLVSILFWIGYFNSALNPVIYAFFNRDFRNAFKRLLGLRTFKCRCMACKCCRRKPRGPEARALAAPDVNEMQTRVRRSTENGSSLRSDSPCHHKKARNHKSYDALDQ